MYVRRLLLCTEYTGAHHWYRRRVSGVPNGLKDAVGTGNALLVYQRGQDISVGPVEGNCGRTVGDIPDSHPSTLGAALSFQIQTTIIPGEKMVVIHPGRHHWLESGAESHFFHPMHKSGIFRHTLSYMTTMEIRSFTYRFLRRTISDAQLSKYQHNKRNIGNSYIVPFVFSSTGAISSVCAPMAEMNCLELDRAQSIKQDNAGGDHFSGSHRHFVLLMLPSDIHSFMNII